MMKKLKKEYPGFDAKNILLKTRRTHHWPTYDLNPWTKGCSIGRKSLRCDKEVPTKLVTTISATADTRGIPLHEYNDLKRARFVEILGDSIASNEGVLTIYVHGFNEDFDDNVSTAIKLNTLGELLGSPKLAREYQESLGTLMLYSWPTRMSEQELYYNLPKKGYKKNSALANYLLSQFSADSQSSVFSELMREIQSKNTIKKINIIAHSMGARVVLEKMHRFLRGSDFDPHAHVNVFLMHGDYGVAEFLPRAKYANELAQESGNFSVEYYNYWSETDYALLLSSLSNLLKYYHATAENLKVDTYPARQYGRYIRIRNGAVWVRLSDESKLNRTTFERILDRLQKIDYLSDTKISETSRFFYEDFCRIGGRLSSGRDRNYKSYILDIQKNYKSLESYAGPTDRWVEECNPLFEDKTINLQSTDVSGFGTDAYRHGAFVNSYSVASDFACSLINTSRTSGKLPRNISRERQRQEGVLITFDRLGPAAKTVQRPCGFFPELDVIEITYQY